MRKFQNESAEFFTTFHPDKIYAGFLNEELIEFYGDSKYSEYCYHKVEDKNYGNLFISENDLLSFASTGYIVIFEFDSFKEKIAWINENLQK